MEIGLVRKVDIDEEMQQAYLDYAMSVIVARALPDARDGLKPVHRRILYAMHDMGLGPNTAYKKSARIVGEVLGKYHPHGDMAVYDAMARMAQDFSMRLMLVDGQGNFGSLDGDPPAAMRYTEARLAQLATHILADINKDTVDFADNFDGTLTEPEVLPSAFPNMLVNGATGIAVGMATSIPPHNLGEVVDALVYMLENWEKLDDIPVEDLMRFIKGPDFPTGGVILQDSDGNSLTSAYATGRGRVTLQAHAYLEEMSRGRNRIIVTELPYMTNKSSLIERIAELAREERLEGIADLRDESDRHGMRIVIELNKAADPDKVLRDLYKNTQMRTTFSIILLALVEGEPRLLSLKQALRVYLDHRQTIIRRRSQYELERARQRAHILEGLRVALKNLDEVINMIRRAPDAETARTRLMKRFKLTEIQANAILDMPLRRLATLERKKIEDEYKEVQAQIKNLESLLRSPKKMRQVVSEELVSIRDAFSDPRRTRIVRMDEGGSKATLLRAADLVPEQSAWVMVSPDGLVARTEDEKLPRLSGHELAASFIQANTRDTLYLVAENGEAAAIPMHLLPKAARPSEGTAFAKLSPLAERHRLAAVFSLPEKGARPEGWYLLTATRQGMVKKTELGELPDPAAQTFTLVRVNEGDRLGWALLTDGQSEILLASAGGMAIRFKEEEVRPMGLVAAGVIGIKLQAGDEITGAAVMPKRGEIFMAASDGTAKRVAANQFPTQGRYGQGVIAWKLPKDVRVAGVATGKGTTRVTLLLESGAPKTVRLDEAVQGSRAARGKPVVTPKKNERLTGVSVLREAPFQSGPDGRGNGKTDGGEPGDGGGPQAIKSAQDSAGLENGAGPQAGERRARKAAPGDKGTARASRTKASSSRAGSRKAKSEEKPAAQAKPARSSRSSAANSPRSSSRKPAAEKEKAADAKPARTRRAASAARTQAKSKPATSQASQASKTSKPAAGSARPTSNKKTAGEEKPAAEGKPARASRASGTSKTATASSRSSAGKTATKKEPAASTGPSRSRKSQPAEEKTPARKTTRTKKSGG